MKKYITLKRISNLFKSEMDVAWWEGIKDRVRRENDIPPISYNTWIAMLTHEVQGNKIVVKGPYDHSQIDYIRKKYGQVFERTIEKQTGSRYEVLFVEGR